MTVVRDPVVMPVAEILLDCLSAEIAKVPTPPAQVCLRLGASVDLLLSTTRDECCEGLAWVRLVSFYPSREFPEQDLLYQNCPSQWAVVFELGVARCAPRPSATELPDCDTWTLLASDIMDDAAAMRRVATCCFPESYPDKPVLAGLWEPITTEGGCAGGTMQLTVSVDPCDCLEDA